MNGFFLQAIVYLSTAIVCVPLAKRLGMGSVLGYLLAGIIIGPFVLAFIGEEGQDIMHFAEFGVVMMLFLIGLELDPAKFWRMRKLVLGSGSIQLGLTSILLFGAFLAMEFSWQAALAIGLTLSMSSTAIVLQSLKEKGQMQSAAGQSSFSILLFQDIAVIPILAILPLLAMQSVKASAGHESFVEGLSGGYHTLVVFGAIATVIVIGKFVVVPVLHLVAKTRLRELFTASALLLVVAIAYLMESVGLSPALGTFLAGMVLANSAYRHELESDLEPFKGLLLGLFFIAVGASINFDLIVNRPVQIAGLVLGIMLVKALVLFLVGKIFHLKLDQNLLLALGLSQVGEFAFVLFSFINQLQILSVEWIGIMMVVTAISMTLTPLFMLINEKVILPKIGTLEKVEKQPDAIDEHHKIIIAGFSHFGSTVGRFLRANGVEATILDNDSDRVDLLRKMGFKVYYGDATRPELLQAAGADTAEILIIAIDSPHTNVDLVKSVNKHFPHLKLLVRSKNRFDAYDLMDLGVKNVYRESVDASLRLGVDVLKLLGFRTYSATRSAQNFLKYDEEAMQKLAATKHDMKQYISNVRSQIELQEQLLKEDRQNNPSTNDQAWDGEHMRKIINQKTN